jgi:hypothetical protein
VNVVFAKLAGVTPSAVNVYRNGVLDGTYAWTTVTPTTGGTTIGTLEQYQFNHNVVSDGGTFTFTVSLTYTGGAESTREYQYPWALSGFTDNNDPPPPSLPIGTLTASAISVPWPSGSVTLTWTSTGATSATLNGASVALNGSQVVTVSAETAYTLALTNIAGTFVQIVTVFIEQQPEPPILPGAPLGTFTASMASLPFGGGEVTLFYAVTGLDKARTVTINGQAVPQPSGAVYLSVQATTEFTCIFTNDFGSSVYTLTVTVSDFVPSVMPTEIVQSYDICAALRDSMKAYNNGTLPVQFLTGNIPANVLEKRGEIAYGAVLVYEEGIVTTGDREIVFANNNQAWKVQQRYGIIVFWRAAQANETDLQSEQPFLNVKDMVLKWLYWLQATASGADSLHTITGGQLYSIRLESIRQPVRSKNNIATLINVVCGRNYITP